MNNYPLPLQLADIFSREDMWMMMVSGLPYILSLLVFNVAIPLFNFKLLKPVHHLLALTINVVTTGLVLFYAKEIEIFGSHEYDVVGGKFDVSAPLSLD